MLFSDMPNIAISIWPCFGKRAFTFTGSCCIGDKCNAHSVAHNVAPTVAHTVARTTPTSEHLHMILFVCLMVLNATFNNISAISWRSALLVEETGGPG
jgi:hypothetical protein